MNKEDLILDTALKIFEKKGFNATTTSEIAREAGIAEGTIFRYFKTKKDILRKILIKAIEVLSPTIISKPVELLSHYEGKDEKEVLKSIFKERLSFISTHIPIIKTVFTEAMVHDEIRQTLVDNVILKIKPIFEVFFDKMISEGKFRNVDKDCALKVFVGSFITTFTYQYLFNFKYSEEEADKIIDNTLDILLYGLSSNN